MTKSDSGGDRHSQIDDNLKRVYEDILSEDMPQRFKDLLDRLDAGENKTPPRED